MPMTIDQSLNQKIALLSLLKGILIDGYLDLLRKEGGEGPFESDYIALQSQGLCQRGENSGAWIPTPRGRQEASRIALMLAKRHGYHDPRVGIDQKTRKAFFRCSCGAHVSESIDVRGAYSRCRRHYDVHCDRIVRAVETSAQANGNSADAEAMMAGRLARYIERTQRRS
jgi:hypothetical protein